MEYRIMAADDLSLLCDFEKMARETEPGVLFGEIKEEFIMTMRNRISDPLYSNTRVILAVDDKRAVGRCDFTMKASYMDGFRDAYVDWIYVLKSCRHRGIGQGLISYMEGYLKGQQIEEYFLVTAHNEEAQSFYTHFRDYTRSEDWILRKEIR